MSRIISERLSLTDRQRNRALLLSMGSESRLSARRGRRVRVDLRATNGRGVRVDMRARRGRGVKVGMCAGRGRGVR